MKIGVVVDDFHKGIESVWYTNMIRQLCTPLRHNYIYYESRLDFMPKDLEYLVFLDVNPPIFVPSEFDFIILRPNNVSVNNWREENPCRQVIDRINEKTNKNLSLPTACDYSFILHTKETGAYEFLKQTGETKDYIEDMVNHAIVVLVGSKNLAKTWVHVAKSLANEDHLKNLNGDLLTAVKHGMAFSKI